MLARGGQANIGDGIHKVGCPAGAEIEPKGLIPTPAACLVVIIPLKVTRLCRCGRELFSETAMVCDPCADRARYLRIPWRARRAAMKMAVATPRWGPSGRNNQRRIYAEFSMPHRFGDDD